MSLVSIIMPYYKKEFYVQQSIKSILNQSYQNFEIILINDDVKNKHFINKISKLCFLRRNICLNDVVQDVF